MHGDLAISVGALNNGACGLPEKPSWQRVSNRWLPAVECRQPVGDSPHWGDAPGVTSTGSPRRMDSESYKGVLCCSLVAVDSTSQ